MNENAACNSGSSKTVAIHQPNFFPWLGYFDKIVRSDIFILLDHVQLPKKGGTWSNRVKLLIGNEARWLTAPIDRSYHGVRAISEIQFLNDESWRKRVVNTITQSYRLAPFYSDTMDLLEPLIVNPETNVALFNGHAVVAIADQLGVDNEKFMWSSKLFKEKHSNEMLISLVKGVGGDTYLCGGGADYHDDALFTAAGLEVKYQNFQSPAYAQIGTDSFIPGLSIIDAFMNVGLAGVRELLRLDAPGLVEKP